MSYFFDFDSLSFTTFWVFEFFTGDDGFLSPYEQENRVQEYNNLIAIMAIEGGEG